MASPGSGNDMVSDRFDATSVALVQDRINSVVVCSTYDSSTGNLAGENDIFSKIYVIYSLENVGFSLAITAII